MSVYVCPHVWEREAAELTRGGLEEKTGENGLINWWHVFKHQGHLAENTEQRSVGLHVQMSSPRLFIDTLIKLCTEPLSCCLFFCFSL